MELPEFTKGQRDFAQFAKMSSEVFFTATRPTRILMIRSRSPRLAHPLLAIFAVVLILAGCQAPGPRNDGRLGLFGKPAGEKVARRGAVAQSRSNGKSGKPAAGRGGSFVLRVAEGRNLEKIGQWDEAREVYKRLRDDYPERPEPYHRLAVVADRQRRHDEAQQLYTRALQLSPRDPELFNDLGYCFYLQGKLEKAESALRKAVRLEPDNSRFHNNLGMVLGQQQRHDEALKAFAATGSDADALFNLAFVYASQDQHEEAKSCFRQALSLDPTHDQAREALASFEQYDKREPLGGEREELVAEETTSGGVAYVPYVEGGEQAGVVEASNESAVSDATGTSATASGNVAASAGGGTQLLSAQRQAGSAARKFHAESAGLLKRRLASQREDERPAGGDSWRARDGEE